jgi:hypothetical protein
MTITLTREEAQQVLDVMEGSIDAQEWEIDDHITKYGEWFRPQRIESMKRQLADANSTVDLLRARLAQPLPDYSKAGFGQPELEPELKLISTGVTHIYSTGAPDAIQYDKDGNEMAHWKFSSFLPAPEPEPVAWMEKENYLDEDNLWETRTVLRDYDNGSGVPLYTAPPQREWRNAAIRLGEELSSVGPDGYYNMTAQQWLDWAMKNVTPARLAQPEQRTGDCLLAGVCAAEGHRIQKAQPEPPWINNTQTGNFFNVAQPEPEPVAWDNCVAGLAEARLCKSWCGNFNCSATEPQRKEWQGLTDDEIIDTANNAPFDTMVSAEDYIYVIARAIEAKLKEKNA